jgi:hypothetical protein
MDVRVLKLVTGEEIVGEFVSETKDSITVKNTLSLLIQPNQQGVGYAFVPWCPMVQGDKKIKLEKTIFTANATDELERSYSSMFSQIMTPPPKQLIT